MPRVDQGNTCGADRGAPVNAIERALTFECDGERLVGVVALPDRAASVGVLIVVGGPQYRAGSHRQFVHLARRLARGGIAAMRFDYRGMGDASGDARSFDDVSADIAAAIAAFQRVCPTVGRVVIWGLCDAASAALIYADANRDASLAGIALVNPWVRSDTTMARTQIRHYYAKRLFDRAFWAKLIRGGVELRDALGGVARAARIAHGAAKPDRDTGVSFQDRMASGLSTFAGPVLLILSGRDLTAREFEEYSSTDARWKGLLARRSVERRDFADADHTFSAKQWRDEVETATVDWVERQATQAAP